MLKIDSFYRSAMQNNFWTCFKCLVLAIFSGLQLEFRRIWSWKVFEIAWNGWILDESLHFESKLVFLVPKMSQKIGFAKIEQSSSVESEEADVKMKEEQTVSNFEKCESSRS